MEKNEGNNNNSYEPSLYGRTKQQFLEDLATIPPGLELFDLYRAARVLQDAKTELQATMLLSTSGLSEDLSCPICMGTYQRVMVVKNCLHRFCSECIEKWLRSGHQDCPKCRNRIPSRRSLRPDPIFERMIHRLFPNVKEFEAMNDNIVAKVNKRKSLGGGASSTDQNEFENTTNTFSHNYEAQQKSAQLSSSRRRGRPPNLSIRTSRGSSVNESSLENLIKVPYHPQPVRASPTSSESLGAKVDVVCIPDRSVEILKDAPQKKLLIRQGISVNALAKYLVDRIKLPCESEALRFFTKSQPTISFSTTMAELIQSHGTPLSLYFSMT